MQKLTLNLFALVAGLFLFVSCSNMQGKDNESTPSTEIPKLLKQPLSTGSATEWEALNQAYDEAVAALQKNPNDYSQYLALAQVYLSHARLTGESQYYSNAALLMSDNVLKAKPANTDQVFQAHTYKAVALMSLHQFASALKEAQDAYAITAHNAQLLGVLVDAQVELGNYKEAIKYCDEMMQLRPDIRSYSRVSYLRQIHGDYPGAIEAMQLAVEAGVPGAESTEWARVILGDLLIKTGDLTNAAICFETADGLRADYAYAKAGLGRLEMAKGNYAAAEKYTQNAIAIISDVAFNEQLADIYALKGDEQQAATLNEQILNALQRNVQSDVAGYTYPHNASRELATACLRSGELSKAKKYAKEDLAMRPDNIDANALMAWILFKSGDAKSAVTYLDKAMATGIKDPEYLYKAGTIYQSTGDAAKATAFKQSAEASRKDVAKYALMY